MLSVFPDLLVYSLLAPFILRLTLGFIFIRFGALSLSGDRHRLIELLRRYSIEPAEILVVAFGVLELLAGLSLVLGLYTQVGALIAGIISLGFLIRKLRGHTFGADGILFDFALLSIALSLLFSGAGLIAFDLPL